MAALFESAVEAVELEQLNDSLPDIIAKSTSLWGLFKREAEHVPIANVTSAGGVTRGSLRVPFRVQGGSGIAQTTADGTAMGRGTGSQYTGFAVSPVPHFNVCEISDRAIRATKGRERGIISLPASEIKYQLQSVEQGLESMVNSDGSGTIDTIPATATVNNGNGAAGPGFSSIVGLNTALSFVDQQVVQVFPSGGGAARGSFSVSFVDGAAQTIFSSQALPAGTVVGDFLVIAGSAGPSVGGSLLGLKAWHVNSNTGTIGGLSRSNFLGRLSTPTINLSGGPLTPGVGNRAQALMMLTMGPDHPGIDKGVWYGHPSQQLAISNYFYNVQFTQAVGGGDTVPDRAKKYMSNDYAGRTFVSSPTATPSRIDLVIPNNWVMGEEIPLEIFDFGGGQTIVQVPDTGSAAGTGSYLFSKMMAYLWSGQLVCKAPRLEVYIQNAAQALI